MQAFRFMKGEPGRGIGENSKEDEHHNREHRAHLDHGILDPHIWTSPPLVLVQAENILQGLIGIDRGHRTHYESRYRDFVDEIESLHRELKRVFANRKGTRFMVWHPAWGYFAQTYGLIQIPIEAEGKEPKPSRLRHLIEFGKEHQLKVIFSQPQLSTRSARMIAKAVGAELVLIDPLAQDWGKNMKAIARAFDHALR
jgi:zinc transport system substrate-binding protein